LTLVLPSHQVLIERIGTSVRETSLRDRADLLSSKLISTPALASCLVDRPLHAHDRSLHPSTLGEQLERRRTVAVQVVASRAYCETCQRKPRPSSHPIIKLSLSFRPDQLTELPSFLPARCFPHSQASQADSHHLGALCVQLINHSLEPASRLHLAEDARLIWVALLRNAASPSSLDPGIVQLAQAAISQLEEDRDSVDRCLEIVDGYVLIAGKEVYQVSPSSRRRVSCGLDGIDSKRC
jgi:hypothetical protein